MGWALFEAGGRSLGTAIAARGPPTQETIMTTNFDPAIAQAKSTPDVSTRANQILQSFEDQLTAAGTDQAKQKEFLAALRSNRAKLVAAIAGDD
jgi:hypothetical protein